jgi:hypothetical protein
MATCSWNSKSCSNIADANCATCGCGGGTGNGTNSGDSILWTISIPEADVIEKGKDSKTMTEFLDFRQLGIDPAAVASVTLVKFKTDDEGWVCFNGCSTANDRFYSDVGTCSSCEGSTLCSAEVSPNKKVTNLKLNEPNEIVLHVYDKCGGKISAYATFKIEYKTCTPDIAGKGIACRNYNQEPVCKGDVTNGVLALDIDHCSRASAWRQGEGVPEDLVICTADSSYPSCGDAELTNIKETLTDKDGKTYRISYCEDPCKSGCEGSDSRLNTCLNRKYSKGEKLTQIVSGVYATIISDVHKEVSTCRFWYNDQPATSGVPYDWRVQKILLDAGSMGYYRAINDSVSCPYGCASGACKSNTAPVLRSITGTPAMSRIGGKIFVSSIGYDPDTFYDLNGTINYKEPIRLVCSSEQSINQSGVDTGGGFIIDPVTGWIIIPTTITTNTTYVPDLCVGSFSFTNPNCTITVPSTFTDGDRTIYCRIIDRNGSLSTVEKSFTVKIDNKPPTVEIQSPPDGSVQVRNFYVNVKDIDENGMNYCQYSITNNGVITSWTNRTCNTRFSVLVGAGKHCTIGDCIVTVIGFDMAGNNKTDTRTYNTNYVFSNITSPESGTWQRRDFNAYATDIDYAGGKIVQCFYRVRNLTNVTKDWTQRLCNDFFNVSIGLGKDCNVQSKQNESTCIVDVRAVNNESISGSTTNVFYKIDWTTPTSNITAPGTEDWLNDDFDVTVEDTDYFGLGFSKCEYMVISNNDTTKYWTDRLCNNEFKVYIGEDGDCKNEGAGTCTVKVRAIGMSGNNGIEDARTYSIILSDVDDLDGFSRNEYYQTDTGVSFIGELKKTLSVPIFRVCNKGFTISECENAFTLTAQDCGINKPCLCGSNSGLTCEINCADMESKYYLLATGMDMSTYSNAKVISPVKDFICPFMNISGLNNILIFFNNLDQTFSVQIMQLDYLIRHTNNTNQSDAWKNQMGRYIDARLLARQHIKYLEGVIAEPSVTKSIEAFNETEKVKQQILEILNAVDYVPTSITLSANFANSYKIFTNVSIPAIIEKFGNRTIYAKVACTITKPSSSTILLNSTCMAEPYPTFNIDFAADQIGDWNIHCALDGSTRTDCEGSIEYYSLDKTFRVMPFEEPKITRITVPTNVMNSSKANVIVEATSTEQSGLYGQAVCIFKDPYGITYDGMSICAAIPRDANASFNAGVTVRKIGTWNVTKCILKASTRSDCASSTQSDEKLNVGSFEAIVPSNLYISSVNVPGEVVSGTKATIGVSILNPVDDRYSKVACTINGPSSSVSLASDCVPILSGSGYTFAMSFTPEAEGMWNVASCSVDASASGDCAGSVTQHTVTDAASFNVIKGRNLTVRSITYASPVKINATQFINFQVRNPTDVDRFGYVLCALTKSNGQPISNRTACTKFIRGTSTQMSLGYFASLPGTWSIDSCVVYGSMWNDCNGATIHGSQYGLGTFDVVTELKSYIEYRRLAESVIFIDNPIRVMSDVKNPDTDRKYLYVTCSFKDPYNATFYNSSACQTFDGGERRTVETQFTANVMGKWYVLGCTLNVSSETGCFGAKTHNVSADVSQVDVRSPFLKIISVTPPSSGLQVGDEAIIYVDVKNYVETNITAFVNCTLKSPANVTYNLTSGIQKIPKGETKTFTLSKVVNTEGDWTLLTCAAYKIMSPATKEHELSLDEIFTVLAPRPRECTMNTDCSGTDDRCYCSQNTCVACSAGEQCKNNACVTYQPQCITDADCPAGHKCQSDTCIRIGDCTYDADCQTGYKCEAYVCKKMGQCTYDYDCENGYSCFNYRCEKIQKPLLDQNSIIFIMIIIIVLIVPFLIYSYMKRAI